MRPLLLIAALAAPAAAGGDFQVEPTRIDLSTRAPAGGVIVTNHGPDPLRLEATAFRWTDDLDGEPRLVPAPEVIVRPAIVEIPSGTSRTLRVGTTASSRDVEASYRVFFEELPDPRTRPRGQITVLTKVGVPVFVAAKRDTRGLQSRVAVAEHRATMTVSNTGTTHAKLLTVKVTAMRAGVPLWHHEAPGWYVLAGAERRFTVKLDGDACAPGIGIVGEIVDEDEHAMTTPLTSCD